jgi:hypothetical protein
MKLDETSPGRKAGVFPECRDIVLRSFHIRNQGIERLWALSDTWLNLVEHRSLPAGYFFSGAFFRTATQHGPIPRHIRRVVRDWKDTLEEAIGGRKMASRRNDLTHKLALDFIVFHDEYS